MYNIDQTYCLVNVSKKDETVILYVYRGCNYPDCFTASKSIFIYRLISLHNIFYNFSISHLLCIAQELFKAEISLCIRLILISLFLLNLQKIDNFYILL